MNHYMNSCQITILHLQTEMDGLVHELADHPTPAFLENILRVMKHIMQQWQAELDWVKGLREQEMKMGTPSHPETPPHPKGGRKGTPLYKRISQCVSEGSHAWATMLRSRSE